MKNYGLVSVITPSYNAESFLSQAIESVIAQTYPYWEMIVIDDGSTDNTTVIAETYASKNKKIKLIKFEKNKGVAVARNTGIENASGRYIAFLDSDDLWLPIKLERQIIFMEENDLYLTYSSYYVTDEIGKLKGIRRVKENITYNDLLKTNWIGNLTGIYDASKLGKIFMENVKHEDYTLWLKILRKVKFTKGILEPLAKYRILSNSYSSNKLRTALWTWNIYRKIERLNYMKSLYYFMHYVYYGIKKRVL